MAIETGKQLTQTLNNHLAHRQTSSNFDHLAETEALLMSIGASTQDTGGNISFYGQDPIVPSVVRFGAMSAVALAAKAALVAAIWKERTGQSQDIKVDVRKALHRFSPFFERKWELVNGYDGGMYSDPDNPVAGIKYKTKDGKWVMPTNIYPQIHAATLKLLNVPSTQEAVAAAISNWNGEDLELAAEKAGIVMPLGRSLKQIMEMDVYKNGLQDMPLIKVEKISDSAPVPYTANPEAPLSGIRALGLAHVIAGPSIGRALALHGADVLNVWNPQDWEHNVFLYTSHIGMRSTTLRLADVEAKAKMHKLLASADCFFANRRAHYLDKHGLDAKTLCKKYPGLIHTSVVYATENGPWSERAGFDVSTGFALGLDCLEGTDDEPDYPPIYVVNDYAAGWLATIGTLQAMRRRAVEGGSYKVTVSLSRTTIWLMSMGIFDKAYTKATAGSSDQHTYVDPDQFTAETPMGTYEGVTEQVEMSRTPGHYKYVMEPKGAAKPVWLNTK